MGWTLTGVEFDYAGKPAFAAEDGNNVAWCCPCGHPVLLVYQPGRKGSSLNNAARCNKCGFEYYLKPSYGELTEPPRGVTVRPAEKMEIVRK